MNKTHIILHHSYSPDRGTSDWNKIRRYHTQDLGWSDIGYHFGLEMIGPVCEVLLGRMPHEKGAHARELGMNRLGLGICCVGNYDQDHLPPAMFHKLRDLIRWLLIDYEISPRNLWGHRDVGRAAGYDWRKKQYKSCPGHLFPLDQIKELFQP
jgi:hypothetical protein